MKNVIMFRSKKDQTVMLHNSQTSNILQHIESTFYVFFHFFPISKRRPECPPAGKATVPLYLLGSSASHTCQVDMMSLPLFRLAHFKQPLNFFSAKFILYLVCFDLYCVSEASVF